MKQLLVLITLALTSTFASASGDLMMHHPYARATPPNAPASAVFLTIMNHSDKDRTLVSASTPAAGKVELHDHIMEGDVMKMRQVKNIVIPANSNVVLKPGSLHIMMFELKHNFSEGSEIEVTANFADGESITFKAPVKKVMAGMKMKH